MDKIILASASPRRAELLDQIGVSYKIQAVNIDENNHFQEKPEALVKRLAEEKSQAIKNSVIPVLGSDTLGTINNELLIKPKDFQHAKSMLQKISGEWHDILTAVSITYLDTTKTIVNNNRVLFREITNDEIQAYWNTGEPHDKAGAYAIQGIAACFIEKIEGSYSGIMGLPLFETSQLLEQFGISIMQKENK